MTKEKWEVISAIVTEARKKEVDQKARANGMSRNEYINARLFDDRDDQFNSKLISDIDKRNYVTICKSYNLCRHIAFEVIKDRKKIHSIEQEAIDNAISKDLMPSDYKPKPKK